MKIALICVALFALAVGLILLLAAMKPDRISVERSVVIAAWSMHGTNVYMMKVMSVFVSPDRMIGGHFETGLANLKAAAENR